MPTGLTYPIHDGQEGFGVREYAESMLHQFGAFIMSRDDDPKTVGRSPKLEDTSSHENGRRDALQRLLQGPSREEYDREVEKIHRRRAEEAELHIRLNEFRDKLKAIHPPEDPELSNLYGMMMDQLFKVDTEGLDGRGYWTAKQIPTFEEWSSEWVEKCHRDAEYHAKAIVDATKRNEDRLSWARRACEWIDTLPSGKDEQR